MKESAFKEVFEFLKNQNLVDKDSAYKGIQVNWYERSQSNFNEDVELVRRIMDQVRPETTIELAAGAGRIAIPSEKLTKRYFALDNSEEMLLMLKEQIVAKNIKNIECQLFDFNLDRVPPPLESTADFLLLANNSIFYSIDEAGCFMVLEKVARMLKPGGLFFLDWSPVSPGGASSSLLSMCRIEDPLLGNRVEIVNPVFDPINRKRKLHFLNLDFSIDTGLKLSYYEQQHYIPSVGEILQAARLIGFETITRYSDYTALRDCEDFRGSQCGILFRKRGF